MLKFAPIMPAFCLLLLYSYYSNNFAGEIDGSLNPSVLKVMGRCLIFIIFGGVIYVLADKSITMPGS